MTVFDVKAAREDWTETISQCDPEKLVYLDESSVNTDMSRLYGRARGGERSVDNVPRSTPQSTTILSSVRLNGETAYTTYSGGTTKDKFLDYLKNVLLPTLGKDDVVVIMEPDVKFCVIKLRQSQEQRR